MQFTEVSGDLVAAKMTEGEKVTIHVPENCEEEGCFLGLLAVCIPRLSPNPFCLMLFVYQ